MREDLLAHVKWFTDPAPFPTQYGLLLTPPVLAAFAAALGAVLVAAWVQRSVPEPDALRILEALRDKLTSCIGCGCLSLRKCGLFNRGDQAAARGAGPRLLYPRGLPPMRSSKSERTRQSRSRVNPRAAASRAHRGRVLLSPHRYR